MKIFFISLLLWVAGSAVFAQESIKLDDRTIKHYSKEQIEELTDISILQINYLFNESFIIPEEMKEFVNAADIDILDYHQCRLPKERKKVFLVNPNASSEADSFTDKYIILFSVLEVQDAINKIEFINKKN